MPIIVNRFTGDKVTLPFETQEHRTQRMYKKRMREFEEFYVNQKGYTAYFLTVSLDGVHDERWVSGLLRAMRIALQRADCSMAYMCVCEIQAKRYRKFGDLKPHWHIVIATSEAGLLPVGVRDQDTGKIIKLSDGKVITWNWLYKNVKQKFGMYFICQAWGSLSKYLGKYMGKDEEWKRYRREHGGHMRRFACSRVPIIFQMTGFQFQSFVEHVDEYSLNDFYAHREGSKIVFRYKDMREDEWWEDKTGNVHKPPAKYREIYTILSDWKVEEVMPVQMLDR